MRFQDNKVHPFLAKQQQCKYVVKGPKNHCSNALFNLFLMPNIRKLQESKRCGKRCDNQSDAMIDAVARKLNKENTSYCSKKGEQTKNRQEHRNTKISRNEELK